MHRWIAVLFSCAALAGASTLPSSSAQADEGQEKVVSLDQIPAAARTGLLREAAGAPIQKVEQETENGRTVYEGHVTKGNDVVGVVVDAEGKLVGTHSEKDEEKGEHE
jgi:uncharacterized membrane protein YkoI